MWFEAFASQPQDEWFVALLQQLLRGDAATASLLKTNHFRITRPISSRALPSIPVHDRGRAPADRTLVEPAACREYVPPITLAAFAR
jgi:hypothetical protein